MVVGGWGRGGNRVEGGEREDNGAVTGFTLTRVNHHIIITIPVFILKTGVRPFSVTAQT